MCKNHIVRPTLGYNEPLPDGTPKGSTTDWSLAPHGAWEACGSNSSIQLLLAGVFMGSVTLGAFSPFMGDIIATNSIHRFDFQPSMCKTDGPWISVCNIGVGPTACWLTREDGLARAVFRRRMVCTYN